jgi:3-isopropylmalate/(R)-2-methylmalate dehydratase small subunit
MEPLLKHKGIVALLDRSDIDTDQIIPKEFLNGISKSALGRHLFHDWRYLRDGSLNPSFELNQDHYQGASILLSGDNFGCGSSREHAPWALLDYGFKVIISTGFADIFYDNCFKNGILPIRIRQDEWLLLAEEVILQKRTVFTVDLEEKVCLTEKGKVVFFKIDIFRQKKLLEGLDDLTLTLQSHQKILCFEHNQQEQFPWI